MPLTSENDIAHKAIGYAIEVHRSMGPGLEKSVYQACLRQELVNNSRNFEANVQVPLVYKNTILEQSYNIDFILDSKVVIILDTSETIPDHRIHSLVKILQEKHMKLGLIINFNYALMKNGIRRVTNNKMLENLGFRNPLSE